MDFTQSSNVPNMAVDKHPSRGEQTPGGAHSQMQNATPAGAISLPLASTRKISSNTLSFLPIKIGTREIRAMVDSGASVCFARPEAIPEGTLFQPFKSHVRYAFEGATQPITRSCRLPTRIGDQLFDIRYTVNDKMSTMVTLGAEWMREADAVLHFNGKGIVLQGQTHRLIELTLDDMVPAYYGQNDIDAWLPNREPFVTEIRCRLVEGTRDERVDVAKIRSQLRLTQRFLYDDKAGLYKLYKENTMPRLYVPDKLRGMVIDRVHFVSDAPHPNESRTLQLLCESLYWPEMREQISSVVRGCATCYENSLQQHQYGELLRVSETTTHARPDVTPQNLLALWHSLNEHMRQPPAYAPTPIMPSSTMTRENYDASISQG